MGNYHRVDEPLGLKNEFTLKDVLFLVLDEYSGELAETLQDEFRLTYPFSDGLLGIEVGKMKQLLIGLHLLMSAAERRSGVGNREYLNQGRTNK
jgi:hypothetical protein